MAKHKRKNITPDDLKTKIVAPWCSSAAAPDGSGAVGCMVCNHCGSKVLYGGHTTFRGRRVRRSYCPYKWWSQHENGRCGEAS